MEMHWQPIVILPLKGGRLYVQTVVIICDEGERLDGHSIEQAAVSRIKRACGPERAAWGKVKVDYARKKCVPGTDMVYATLAVVVNHPGLDRPYGEEFTTEGDSNAAHRTEPGA